MFLNENTEPPVDQVQNMEEGAGPGLDPTKSYKMYCVQFNKEEYKSISKQILQGRRQLEKREKEGRPAGIFVNANVKKRRQEKVETVKEYIQRREMEEKEKKENKKKEREDQDKDDTGIQYHEIIDYVSTHDDPNQTHLRRKWLYCHFLLV